ncbi:MAG: MFS transporter [candidate division KSB1 bacterium]|nr:MFS transporter [candidate division KSB1 bacterium]MDZ7305199.1 MFS transporter [candidate division KSB1 bacterium]MDZ7314294.1 MFS transporter [candidate division KSB1 bacterium]
MTTSNSANLLPQPTRAYRWIVLVFISLAMFGNYYIYDSISPLADVLKAQLGYSNANVGLLNAIYSIPNIFMVLIGGFIIDRIGTRKSTLIFAVVCLLGAAITAVAGKVEVMAAGRLVFGLGAESLIVAVTTAIAKWFRGKELSFAFGINLTIARLGSFVALNSPTWAKPAYQSWQLPLLIAVAFGVICVAGAVFYWILERRAERVYQIGEAGATDKVVFSDVFKFDKSYWFVVALCITFYSAIFPFQTFAVDFFIHAHGTTREFGGFLSSMLTLFAMIFTPLFGLLVDRVAKRSLFMMFGSSLLIPVYLIMAYTHVSLYLPMAMMGIAFSLIPAVMWPSVAYIVGQSKLGTAYGLMTMIQNIGLAGFNLLVGWANDFGNAGAGNPRGYVLGMWIFSILGFCGLLFAYLLRRSETGPKAHGLETITAQKAP